MEEITRQLHDTQIVLMLMTGVCAALAIYIKVTGDDPIKPRPFKKDQIYCPLHRVVPEKCADQHKDDQ